MIVLLAAAGAWVSDQLLTLHDSTLFGSSGAKPLIARWCSAGDAESGCERYARSAWSEIVIKPTDKRVSLALLGWAYFSGIGLWYLIGGSVRSGRPWRRWPPLIAAFAGAYASIFYLTVMAVNPGPACVGCVICHVINFCMIAAIAADAFQKSESDDHKRPPSKIFTVWPIGAAILIWIVLLCILMRGRNAVSKASELASELAASQRMVDQIQANPSLLLATYDAQPTVVIPPASLMTVPIPHRLVIFTDMECPACAANALDVDQKIKPLFGRNLLVELREFPLCTDCNSHIKHNTHPGACQAAYAAEAARQLEGDQAYAAMVSSLHAHRTELSLNLYAQLAGQLHLSLLPFLAAMQSTATHTRVSADIELGNSLGVNTTPTLFFDGRRVPEICQTDAFWQAIAARENAVRETPSTAK